MMDKSSDVSVLQRKKNNNKLDFLASKDILCCVFMMSGRVKA